MSRAQTVAIPADTLRAIGEATLAAVGAPPRVADAMTEHLVDANLTGYDSHGIHLLPVYIDDVKRGEIKPEAEPRVEWERGASALVSGDWGFGQYAGRFAMDVAIKLAKQHGVSIVGMVRIHHLGRMGAYMEQAAAAGCAAMSFVSGLGGAVQAAPYGGARSAYGANPFGAGFPSQGGDNLVVDYATTIVAGGKVMIARTTETELPADVLIDSEGRPTRDPEELFKGGALLPFGAHKGYGLALMVELMGRVLTGSDALGEPAGGGDRFGRSGATFIVVDADVFRSHEAVSDEAHATFDRIRQTPPAAGFTEVRIPGERESRIRAERTRNGIELPEVTVAAIAEMARGIGVDEAIVSRLEAPLHQAR